MNLRTLNGNPKKSDLNLFDFYDLYFSGDFVPNYNQKDAPKHFVCGDFYTKKLSLLPKKNHYLSGFFDSFSMPKFDFDLSSFKMPDFNLPDFDFSMPDFNMPDFDFSMPDFNMPSFDMPSFDMPTIKAPAEITDAFSSFTSFPSDIIGGITSAPGEIGDLIGGLGDSISSGVSGIAAGIGQGATGIAAGIGQAVTGLAPAIPSIMDALFGPKQQVPQQRLMTTQQTKTKPAIPQSLLIAGGIAGVGLIAFLVTNKNKSGRRSR